MEAVDAVAWVILAAAVLLLLLVVRRLVLTRRGGCLSVSLRHDDAGAVGGPSRWIFGLGRFERDEMLWFRVFSPSFRPRLSLHRSALTVRARRRPVGREALTLPADAVVFECESADGVIELAVPQPVVPAFLAWLESAPPHDPAVRRRPDSPGATGRRPRRRSSRPEPR